MRVAHFTLSNGSGLNRVATTLCEAERALGLDSVLVYTDGGVQNPPPSVPVIKQEDSYDYDIHCGHSFFPPECKGKKVFFAHGTPEHCFQMAVEQGKDNNYAAGDPFMLTLYQLSHADATVTFWERHAALLKSFNLKANVITMPLGVNKAFWSDTVSRGKWVGEPSLFTCENAHTIKWPIDLMLAWPFVAEQMPKARIHFHYIPYNLHRFIYPLMYANGTAYSSFSSGLYFSKEELRNSFKSIDFYVSPVRYGDHNTTCLEAKAAGCKVISYRGNHYADYWISEGSQLNMANELLTIMKGEVQPFKSEEVPDIMQTAEAMKKLYEQL